MTTTPRPSISVVIPVHNGELYLAEAVDSALAQTHRPAEVVVVDDGSTDGTAEVAAGLGAAVRYVHQRNRGPGGAMNRGVALARGEYVAFLSADDVWEPEKLAGQMAALVADPSLDLVFGHVQHS
jgi:glycosyltransferase involved in cell wall biosynthesis